MKSDPSSRSARCVRVVQTSRSSDDGVSQSCSRRSGAFVLERWSYCCCALSPSAVATPTSGTAKISARARRVVGMLDGRSA